jgi:diguanylate cyclase (GGDEF)-like protein
MSKIDLYKEITPRYDLLTGLLTRKSFESKYSSISNIDDYYLAMVDLDYMMYFNDRYGHIVGDSYISRMALLFNYYLDENEVICRFGGDEFIILLKQNPKEYFKKVNEHLTMIKENDFEFQRFLPDKELMSKITFSAGVTKASEYEVSWRKADELLYKAKLNGRNKNCIEDTIADKGLFSEQ